jgi:hypothetical protein
VNWVYFRPNNALPIAKLTIAHQHGQYDRDGWTNKETDAPVNYYFGKKKVTSATPDVILEKYLKGDISHARQQFLLHILMATPVSFHIFSTARIFHSYLPVDISNGNHLIL